MRRVGSVLSVLAFVAIFFLGVLQPASAAPGWNSETLDAGNSTGAYNSTTYYQQYAQHHVFNQGTETAMPVLRHGWFQPGYTTWAFETLDKGNSTGMATATMVWFTQHHVFNQGLESGQSVLRHGWFEPIVGAWQFETLDTGISTGTDTATVSYKGQQHVFSHGIDSGQDVLRHGWFDLGVGYWQFETLDLGMSQGTWISAAESQGNLNVFNVGRGWCTFGTIGLRHGWFDGAWHFELLSGVPFCPWFRNTAIVSADGNFNVFSQGLHWWYDGRWHDESLYLGEAPSAANYRGQLHTFGIESIIAGVREPSHHWYDGAWQRQLFQDEVFGSWIDWRTSSTVYPVYDQLHFFYGGPQYGLLRHRWYE